MIRPSRSRKRRFFRGRSALWLGTTLLLLVVVSDLLPPPRHLVLRTTRDHARATLPVKHVRHEARTRH